MTPVYQDGVLHVDQATLSDLITDQFSICLSCDGATDHVPLSTVDGECGNCGVSALAGLHRLLALGLVVPVASA